jgi:hypothetical protein
MRDNAQWMAQVELGKANAALRENAAGIQESLTKVVTAQKNATESARYWAETQATVAKGFGSDADTRNALDNYTVMRDRVDELSKTLGLTATQALTMNSALGNMSGAKSMADIERTSQGALDAIKGMFPAGTAVPPAIVEIVENLSKVHEQAAIGVSTMDQMPGALNGAAVAAGGLSSSLGGVTMAANAALAQLIQLDAHRSATQKYAQDSAGLSLPNSSVQPDGSMVYRDKLYANMSGRGVKNEYAVPPKAPRLGGGGGGSRQDKYEDKLSDKLLLLKSENDVLQKLGTSYFATSDAATQYAKAMVAGNGHVDSATEAMIRQYDAAQKLNNELSRLAKDPVKDWLDAVPLWAEGARTIEATAISGLSNSLSTFFQTGKFGMADFVKSLEKMFADILAQQSVKMVMDMLNGTGGGKTGHSIGGTAASGGGGGSWLSTAVSFIAGMFKEGGYSDRAPVSSTTMHAASFSAVPHTHKERRTRPATV